MVRAGRLYPAQLDRQPPWPEQLKRVIGCLWYGAQFARHEALVALQHRLLGAAQLSEIAKVEKFEKKAVGLEQLEQLEQRLCSLQRDSTTAAPAGYFVKAPTTEQRSSLTLAVEQGSLKLETSSAQSYAPAPSYQAEPVDESPRLSQLVEVLLVRGYEVACLYLDVPGLELEIHWGSWRPQVGGARRLAVSLQELFSLGARSFVAGAAAGPPCSVVVEFRNPWTPGHSRGVPH